MTNDIQARYAQAQHIVQGHLSSRLVRNETVFPHWIQGGRCFWYKRATRQGAEFVLVAPATASREPAFDHAALALALGKATGRSVPPGNLPIEKVNISLQPLEVRFKAFGKHWLFTAAEETCKPIPRYPQDLGSPFGDSPAFAPLPMPGKQDEQAVRSPDGSKAAFVRGHNLWIRDLTTGEERALTTDGTRDYNYAYSGGRDEAVQACWSPDSRHLFSIRLDERNIGQLTMTDYIPADGSLRPQLAKIPFARAGDEHVETYQLVVIDVDTGRVRKPDYPPLRMIWCADSRWGFFRCNLGWWSSDNRHAFFIDVARGAKTVRLVRWDTNTGATQVVLEETSDTFVRLSNESSDLPLVLPLPDSNELIWFSERSGWAHLYLYDLDTGKLKHAITEGAWLVRDILHLDPKRRELLLQTAARDPGINPYYRDICKVNIDSAALTNVMCGDVDHIVHKTKTATSFVLLGDESGIIDGVSPCGQYLVVTRTRVDTAPVTVLIDRDGKQILELETTDVSELPVDWVWPEPVKLKAADGQTDIYGVVFRPPGFSPDRSYPVVDYISSARMACSFPQGAFNTCNMDGHTYFYASALAALGFIVVAIEGRGLPFRSKAFLDHHYGDQYFAGDFNDHVAAIRQLGERYPYMDLERVGYTSCDNPINSVYALLRHSDFYKVGVQHSLVDPRSANAAMETYVGTFDETVLAGKCYPEYFADSFDGKLLFIVGMQSGSTGDTFRLVEALQKANKDFEMLCSGGGLQMDGYRTRREWDYLVRHLQCIEPPPPFRLIKGMDLALERYYDRAV